MSKNSIIKVNIIQSNFQRILENNINLNHTNTTNELSNLITIENAWIGGIFTSVGLYFLSVILTIVILITHKKTTSKKTKDYFIYCLISLSIGTLMGDSIIHLLPEVYGLEEEKTEGDKEAVIKEKANRNLIAFFILFGFLIIYIMEKILLMCGIDHSHGPSDNHHGHNHEIDNLNVHGKKCNHHLDSNENLCKIRNIEIEKNEINNENGVQINNNNFQENYDEIQNKQEDKENQNTNKDLVINIKEEINKTQSLNKDENHTTKSKKCCDFLTLKGTKSVGILIIFSEIIHNVIDGIAIGVVFSSRKQTTIISTVIAIILHEIPKELADAGVLIHSNFTFWGILFWNSMSNIGAIFGSIIGLEASQLNDVSKSYLLAFTTGNFIYISLAQLVPILVELKGKCINALILFGILFGIGIMYIIILLE